MSDTTSEQTGGAPMHYLLVDDDAADLELLRTAFESVDATAVIETQQDPAQVINWLDSALTEGDTTNVVVITDLNMPGVRGDELVESIRSRWKTGPPVIVVSTSDRVRDSTNAYAAGANAYHAKPMGYHGTVALCRSISQYWTMADRPVVSRNARA